MYHVRHKWLWFSQFTLISFSNHLQVWLLFYSWLVHNSRYHPFSNLIKFGTMTLFDSRRFISAFNIRFTFGIPTNWVSKYERLLCWICLFIQDQDLTKFFLVIQTQTIVFFNKNRKALFTRISIFVYVFRLSIILSDTKYTLPTLTYYKQIEKLYTQRRIYSRYIFNSILLVKKSIKTYLLQYLIKNSTKTRLQNEKRNLSKWFYNLCPNN